jgi:hypothetical protein
MLILESGLARAQRARGLYPWSFHPAGYKIRLTVVTGAETSPLADLDGAQASGTSSQNDVARIGPGRGVVHTGRR